MAENNKYLTGIVDCATMDEVCASALNRTNLERLRTKSVFRFRAPFTGVECGTADTLWTPSWSRGTSAAVVIVCKLYYLLNVLAGTL